MTWREAIAGVEGWLLDAQAQRLHDRARATPSGGRIVEIGAFRGRSTIVLALGAREGVDVVAIDPHLGSDRGPQELEPDEARGKADAEAFRANLDRAGVAERVRHVRERSSGALDAVDGSIDLLFVDGAHRYRPAADDLVRWGARVRDGGTMLVHDSFSSIGVTMALLRHVAPSRRWRYAGRTASLAEFVADGHGGPASALRMVAQLGWFARNIIIKALILAGLRRGPWPH